MEYEKAAHISGAIIMLAISQGRFSETDVHATLTDPVDPDVIQAVLQQLTEDGWVERQDSKIAYWRTGPLAREYGNMVRFQQGAEGRIPVLPDERED